MSEGRLRGCRVLILEDEYFLADDLEQTLTRHGAEVVGPIPDQQQAVAALRRDGIDAAVINASLRGQKTFDLADELTRQQIPFMFVTGLPARALPARFRDVKVREKPCDGGEIANDVAELCGKCVK